MHKFLMLGKYSAAGVKGIKAERTKKVVALIRKAGGRVNAMYALIGPYDMAFLVDFPANTALIKAAIAITKLTGIGFSSFPAVGIEEFDRAVG
ncbi:GYD domain-containing protein [bacterium]|nr:MAG: GYD domain-containing protein [bacterium]